MYRKLSILALVIAAPLAATALAGNEVYLGRKTAATLPLDAIDHSTWDSLLKKYVDEDGMVDYRAWQASASDIKKLDDYLGKLSSGEARKATSNGRLAFWINAYNAMTIRGILQVYPTTSIRNHTARVFGYNIWKHLQLYIDSKPYSLEGIEHQILRKTNDPRIHFAIVCASIGCPRLLNEAYTPTQVQKQLERNATDFFSRQQNFRHDAASRRFHLSEILSWFGTDFGSDKAAQLKRIAKWLPTNAARQAAKHNTVSISYLEYNWELNAQRK